MRMTLTVNKPKAKNELGFLYLIKPPLITQLLLVRTSPCVPLLSTTDNQLHPPENWDALSEIMREACISLFFVFNQYNTAKSCVTHRAVPLALIEPLSQT